MADVRPINQQDVPTIFLFGLPGAGKTTLGRRACDELGLRFLDLTTASTTDSESGSVATGASDLERLRNLIDARAADVIELPWALQLERRVLTLARQAGIPLFLWAHPEDMISRGGRRIEGLLAPDPRLQTRGGYGRTGVTCREFRQLDRACSATLMLVNLNLELAARALTECIAVLRKERCGSPAEREGIQSWVKSWHHDHGVNLDVAERIVDAMARFLSQLRSSGRSPRTLADIRSDLNAAGQLVLMYEAPTHDRVLECFHSPPWEYEFSRKVSDSPAIRDRYRRNLDAFARFLVDDETTSGEA